MNDSHLNHKMNGMAANGFKKFICQKIILDMFRVYIDMNDEFVKRLRAENILNEEEYFLIEVRKVSLYSY